VNSMDTSYTVLKYRHDAAAGEVLNIGVVLYAPETGQVGALFSPRYGRLSEAFAGFDGDLYHSVTSRLGAALERLGAPLSSGLFQAEERERLVRLEVPDNATGPTPRAPKTGKRVRFPVFTSKEPGVLDLTNEDIARMEDEDDLRKLGMQG
jgi:hypothetical protein